MGIVAKTKSFNKFAKRIANLQKKNVSDIIAENIAIRGEEIAREEYGNADVIISHTIPTQGQVQVVAEGEKISYMEFGTGIVGSGTYEGNLPTQPISFVSPKKSGDSHTTEGWEYNYPNEKTKKDGQGWYYKGEYTQGEPAQAQMFKTAQRLRTELTDIGRKHIKGD